MNIANKRNRTGIIDTYKDGYISGWSYNPEASEQAVLIKINSTPIKTIPINKRRPDVVAKGLAPENCGFEFQIKLETLPSKECIISINDPLTGTPLINGELLWSQEGLQPLKEQNSIKKEPLSVAVYIKTQELNKKDITPESLSEEFCKRLSGFPKSTFAAMAYLTILGRIPDPDGFNGKLLSMPSTENEKRKIINEMLATQEFQSNRSHDSANADICKIPSREITA
ncbi:hypothetical protein [Azotobacter salinestris]|uniref:hypothetical protein n=1 Tax=Azotobacter salinestris TaxID=69964 RepID=UPI0032DEA624